jgi:hypothetical protein
MDPISIELPCTQAGNKDVPIMVSAVDYWVQGDYARWSLVLLPVEKQQFDPRSIP